MTVGVPSPANPTRATRINRLFGYFTSGSWYAWYAIRHPPPESVNTSPPPGLTTRPFVASTGFLPSA